MRSGQPIERLAGFFSDFPQFKRAAAARTLPQVRDPATLSSSSQMTAQLVLQAAARPMLGKRRTHNEDTPYSYATDLNLYLVADGAIRN